jgi:Tfp pilus assembly protein PilO
VTLTRRIALITLGALVIVVGVWYVALWRPAEKHLAALRSEQTSAASNVMTLQAQANALRAEQKQLPKDRVALSQLQAAIPNGPSLDQLIKVVDNAARQAGVSLTSLSTPAPVGWGAASQSATAAQTPGPQNIQVNIGLQGSDHGVLQFITDLDSEPRLFVVNSFTLNSTGSSPTPAAATTPSAAGTYSVSVDAFYISAASDSPVFPGPA